MVQAENPGQKFDRMQRGSKTYSTDQKYEVTETFNIVILSLTLGLGLTKLALEQEVLPLRAKLLDPIHHMSEDNGRHPVPCQSNTATERPLQTMV